jgi:hypothetical protein
VQVKSRPPTLFQVFGRRIPRERDAPHLEALVNPVEQVASVTVGQADVGDEQVEYALGTEAERVSAGRGRLDLVPPSAQQLRDRLRRFPGVFDIKDAHG